MHTTKQKLYNSKFQRSVQTRNHLHYNVTHPENGKGFPRQPLACSPAPQTVWHTRTVAAAPAPSLSQYSIPPCVFSRLYNLMTSDPCLLAFLRSNWNILDLRPHVLVIQSTAQWPRRAEQLPQRSPSRGRGSTCATGT